MPSGKGGQDQYDFIFKPPGGKKSLLPGGSKKTRIIIVAVGAAILLMMALVLSSILSSPRKQAVENLVVAAKQQNDLIRLSEVGVQKARGQQARNIAVTTKLSLQSQQGDLLAAIKSQKRKLDNKELNASRDTKADQLLTAAEQNNRFDEVFIEVMELKLKEYQRTVKTAYDSVSSPGLRAALTEQFNSANTLAGVAAESNN
jgi:flagellar basal body-associated protein FliL